MKNKFLVLYLLSLTFAARADDGLSPAARAWLAERREIVFAGQASYPPFEFVDGRTGEYVGMAVELIRWIATEYGFTASWKPLPFEEAQLAVLRGDADALTGFFKSAARTLRYDFSAPVFSVPASIFTRADRLDIRSAADLRGRRVAVQRGDYAVEHLAELGVAVEYVPADDFRSALRLVAAGQADALIGDEQTVFYHLYAERLDGTIKKSSEPLYVGMDCMAVAKGEAMLLSVLDAGIRRAKATGTLDTIYRKWTGAEFPAPEPRQSYGPGLAIAIAFAAMAILGTAGAWLYAKVTIRAALSGLRLEASSLKAENESLRAANARLRLDLEERSRLEEEKRRIDAAAAARRVEELTRCAIAQALSSTDETERGD